VHVCVMAVELCGFCLHSFSMVFIYMMKSSDERLHPYLTPLLIALHSVFSFTEIRFLYVLY
jgi:hypothetical protein